MSSGSDSWSSLSKCQYAGSSGARSEAEESEASPEASPAANRMYSFSFTLKTDSWFLT